MEGSGPPIGSDECRASPTLCLERRSCAGSPTRRCEDRTASDPVAEPSAMRSTRRMCSVVCAAAASSTYGSRSRSGGEGTASSGEPDPQGKARGRQGGVRRAVRLWSWRGFGKTQTPSATGRCSETLGRHLDQRRSRDRLPGDTGVAGRRASGCRYSSGVRQRRGRAP
jgi:hypothetical protein